MSPARTPPNAVQNTAPQPALPKVSSALKTDNVISTQPNNGSSIGPGGSEGGVLFFAAAASVIATPS